MEPSVIVGCMALMILYLLFTHPRRLRETICFSTGVLALLLTLVSPLDTLADDYLFSAHMFQHLLLVLVVPPLFVLGLPRACVDRLLRWPLASKTEKLLSHPFVAWSLGIGTFFVWHVPYLYNAAVADEELHIAEHLSMLVTAVIFWWPVVTPLFENRLSPMATLLYLMPAGMLSTLLGIVLAYFPGVLYSAYLNPPDPLGILSVIRQSWGLSLKSDQELGGMLMWVPGSLVYIGTIFIRFTLWLSAARA